MHKRLQVKTTINGLIEKLLYDFIFIIIPAMIRITEVPITIVLLI